MFHTKKIEKPFFHPNEIQHTPRKQRVRPLSNQNELARTHAKPLKELQRFIGLKLDLRCKQLKGTKKQLSLEFCSSSSPFLNSIQQGECASFIESLPSKTGYEIKEIFSDGASYGCVLLKPEK